MQITLSEHFNYKKLLRFTLPTIAMMLFTSIYGVVDGIFVSSILGSDAFVAVNLIIPFLMILSAAGFMLGTGGSALVAKTCGEGDGEKARRQFSMLVYVMFILGVVVTVLGIVFLRQIAEAFANVSDELKSDPERKRIIIDYAVTYGTIILCAYTPYILYNAFQSFLVVAERAKLGFYVSVAVGVTNMVLDFLFMFVFGWGIVGAAVATAISQVIGGVVPLVFFMRENGTPLKIVKTKINIGDVLKSCANGSSEMMSNVSMSLINMLYNIQLLKYFGPNGVSAFGVIMYVSFVFVSIFIGFSIGTAPIISYHYGAKNTEELKSVRKKGFSLMMIGSVVMTALAVALSTPLASLFSSGNAELATFTARALMIYSLHFIFSGVNIYGSSFFTALNNGVVSAVMSFVRTLILQVACIFLLPIIFGADAIWFSVCFSEVGALIMTVAFLILLRKKYNY